MDQPSIWVVGDWQYADFSAALAWLAESARCERFKGPTEPIRGCQSAPHAILLLQLRPGQISASEVEQWHAAAPLARLVALVGPWCEGELRSGQPWPGVVRVPWRAWQSRLPAELGMLRTNGAAAPPCPRTASATDRLEYTLQSLKKPADHQTKAIIFTDRKDRCESVADALQTLGLETDSQSPAVSDVNFVIFDGWNQVTEIPPAPNIRKLLFLDFPRPEDHSRAASMGIDSVISLPLLLTDLAMAMERPQNNPS